jgi:hypothetical protein
MNQVLQKALQALKLNLEVKRAPEKALQWPVLNHLQSSPLHQNLELVQQVVHLDQGLLQLRVLYLDQGLLQLKVLYLDQDLGQVQHLGQSLEAVINLDQNRGAL